MSTATTDGAALRRPAVLRTPGELRAASERWRAAGMSVGLVPTMGALHAGHRSLVRRARSECDRVAVSIFVNPAQFGPQEDLARYPRPLDADLALLAEERVDVVYLPSVAAVYPEGFATRVSVTGAAATTLEGAIRPGHFDGVSLIVAKLLIATRADRAYFGAKDAQQCAVVTRLARDLDTGCRIVVCPTVRDADGLALSSRNAYLSPEERAAALAIPRGLAAAARAFAAGERDARTLRGVVLAELERAPGLRPDYVEIVDGESFEQVERAAPGCRIQVAARMASARLIDTLCLGFDEPPVTADTAPATREVEGTAATRSSPCSAS